MRDPLLDKHTLLVTTFERPTYLFRLMKLLREDAPFGRILVADASSDRVKAMNARTIADSALPVEHLLCDHSLSVIALHEVAVMAVDTPFVTFCADDDFVSPEFIRQAVRWLRARPGYAACSGRLAFVAYGGDRVSLTVGSSQAVEHTGALDRVTDHFANFWNADFATWRTEAKVRSCRSFAMFERDEVLGEPLHSLLLAAQGKIGVIDRLSVIRGLHAGNNANRFLEKRLCLVRDGFADHFETFCTIVRDVIADVEAAPVDEAALRDRLFGALIRHISCNAFYFRDSITDGILRQLWPEASRDQIEARRTALRAPLYAALFRDEAQALRASIDADLVDLAGRSVARPATVLRVTGDAMVFYELGRDRRGEDPAPPRESPLPAHYARFAGALIDPGFAARYAELRGRMYLTILPEIPESAAVAFDALALQAMVCDLAALHPLAPGVDQAIATRLPIADGDPYERQLAEAIVGLVTVFPDGRQDPPRRFDAPLPALRVFDERPDPAAVVVPGVLDAQAAKRTGDLVLIPLDTDRIARELAAAPLWVSVTLRVVTGCVQVGLICDGTMIDAPVLRPGDGTKCCTFPVVSPNAEWLMIRDKGAPDGASRIELSALDLLRGSTDVEDCAAPARVASAGR